MRVKTFPGRIYVRRLKALERLQSWIGAEWERELAAFRVEAEKQILLKRTDMTLAQAKAIRTKKNRSGHDGGQR